MCLTRRHTRDERHRHAERKNGETIYQRAAARQKPIPIFPASHGRAITQRVIRRTRLDRQHGLIRAALSLASGRAGVHLADFRPVFRLGFRTLRPVFLLAFRSVKFTADRSDVHMGWRQLQSHLIHGVGDYL